VKDLVCLVADKNMEAALGGLLGRPEALGIRPLQHDLPVHPRRDPGCFHGAAELLETFRGSHRHALVLLDRAWQGAPHETADALEAALNTRLERAGMAGWARGVVIEPELEIWVWSDSPHVEEVLGWKGRVPTLTTWLRSEGLWPETSTKPPDPKAALERALFTARKRRSSAIYRSLATRVSVARCTDPSLGRLLAVLRSWFGLPATAG
jgi:hypothetical protein